MRLACPDRDCATLNDDGAARCEECGKPLGLEGFSPYRRVTAHGHPLASAVGQVAAHRLIAERALGRPLKRGEVVHHMNDDTRDNRPDNLFVFGTSGDHTRYHAAVRAFLRNRQAA